MSAAAPVLALGLPRAPTDEQTTNHGLTADARRTLAKIIAMLDAASRGGGGPNALREDLAARLRKGALRYELRVQAYTDAVMTPIEDGSVEWKEGDSPFVTVADVVLPLQDVMSAKGRRVEAFVEKLSFDPWHASVELRPIGNMMRARNHAYRLSTMERGAAPEPDGSERFDD